MKTIRNNRGFTFTELLLVLTITSIMSTSVLVVGKDYSEKQLIEQALVQLSLDLYAVQSHALGEGVNAKLDFITNGTEYIGTGDSRTFLFKRTLPEGMELTIHSPLKEVNYTRTGTVDKFGAIQFQIGTGEVISVRLQFGKGRVILPEL